jgi:hypothetical protein
MASPKEGTRERAMPPRAPGEHAGLGASTCNECTCFSCTYTLSARKRTHRQQKVCLISIIRFSIAEIRSRPAPGDGGPTAGDWRAVASANENELSRGGGPARR